MPVSLAEAKNNTQTDYDPYVIDEFRKESVILDSLVFAGRRDMVDGVWRAGAKLVTNGRHHRRAEIAARYRQALEYVLA